MCRQLTNELTKCQLISRKSFPSSSPKDKYCNEPICQKAELKGGWEPFSNCIIFDDMLLWVECPQIFLDQSDLKNSRSITITLTPLQRTILKISR